MTHIRPKCFQPPQDLMDRLENDPPKDLPLSDYVYSDRKVFHPSLCSADILSGGRKVAEAVLRASVPLPNGGITWYYPKQFKNVRFLGEYYRCSAYAQMNLLRSFSIVMPEVCPDIVRGLVFPYEEGGMMLGGCVPLEVPHHHGCPEIILNGWLCALVGLWKHYENTRHTFAYTVLRRSMDALDILLSRFDDEKHWLSLYSDVCPYKFRLLGEDLEEAKVTLRYTPNVHSMKSYEYELPDGPCVNPYDSSVYYRSDREIRVCASVSKTFSTRIYVDREVAEAKTLRGEYNKNQSSPGHCGEEVSFKGRKHGNDTVIHVPRWGKLFCGYPTNFSKKGNKNVYHVYHVKALSFLNQLFPSYDNVKRFLSKWSRYIDQFGSGSSGASFADEADVVL